MKISICLKNTYIYIYIMTSIKIIIKQVHTIIRLKIILFAHFRLKLTSYQNTLEPFVRGGIIKIAK